MKTYKHLITIFLIVFITLFTEAFSFAPIGTRLMEQPAIGKSHIAFIYANDLWVANLDGSSPKRLTVDVGKESTPVFSPDGTLIAFSAAYDGNTDVYTIPVDGGIPKRLTWHPMDDVVLGFTPDGQSVLFNSKRTVYTNRYSKLYEVKIGGGYPNELEIPNAWYSAYAPDGTKMAYTPIRERSQQWKNYRGGTIATIWLFSFDDKSVVKIPQPEGGSNDIQPMWSDKTIYFLSDRKGEFNLYSYDTISKEVMQHTQFTDFPVVNAKLNANTIIFEQAGYLHLYDTTAQTTKQLEITIAADLPELRERFVKGKEHIRSATISPSGKRVVFDYRGDIITVPEKKGDPRNITSSPGAHEKYPAWSADGKRIAYFSDVSGEYQLHIKSQDGKGEPAVFELSGTGFYAHTRWSPDNKKISFVDNGRNLYILDIASKKITQVANDEYYFPGAYRDLLGDWSPDSNWITYSKIIDTNFEQIFLYSVKEAKSYPVSDGFSNANEPVFDPNGKYLYFFASTDAGPVVNWFDQSNQDMSLNNAIYLVTLQKETISPLMKESDEEGEKDEASKEEENADTKAKEEKEKSNKEKKSKPKNIQIDLDGIQNRIVALPIEAGSYYSLGLGETGKVLFIANNPNSREQPAKLFQYDLKKRKKEEVMELEDYKISSDGKKMVYHTKNAWGITAVGKKPKGKEGILNVDAMEVKISPVAEWENIFQEAWRINRDYFYDPGMHGSDWVGMKEKYAQFLPQLSSRNDLNRIIQWMCSELSVGHHRLSGDGEQRYKAARVPGGLLGADYKLVNNKYQFKKIYGGLNWNPKLRAPLTAPGNSIKQGDYLLAVNGQELSGDQNIYQLFENTATKIIEITTGPNPNLQNSKIHKVIPVANEYTLRNRDWVEGNLKKVHKATNGQVAYVYVPNTATAGHEYFKRYFFPQANKKAIIIDERFNGGGQIADYYINLLMNPYQSHWNFRYGSDLKTPSASIQGPKVMLIDETAGSGGDMLPWMFRKFEVGTLVGKRTWGGLVGILGFPEFIDGATVTAPNVAIWTEEGFIVENVGVAPDVEVEQTPAAVISGKDPQLEKAIDIIMGELKTNPPKKLTRPPYPKRAAH